MKDNAMDYKQSLLALVLASTAGLASAQKADIQITSPTGITMQCANGIPPNLADDNYLDRSATTILSG